ncbi:glycosyltransferase [Saccharothrix longispora]|uniref:UDP:flavonoid glycosyltransferase YjiC (YdhE family) n=1 Tax=Saccharothrix longispora TaxID=33920 RepID=A0ABU1PVL9_9PSEU|nr:glycosyltransferase [Saccharothrix longispora]MDR6594343.1 UDP:flavonoid glycosyltransferase YjiC (YdhE family) [Saccharothrix longispora]
MSRFLLVVLPLQGHLYPMLAIGQELARAGHDVVWCGPENVLRPLVGPDATVHATGVRAYRRYDENGMAGLRALWDGYLLPFARFTLGPVDEAVALHRPDVVVTEQYALAGGLVAHRRGVRWATLCTGTLELTPPEDLPEFDGFVADRVARAVAMAGLPADAPVDPRFSPHLVIALMTRGLVGDAELPDRCVLTGAALGPRPNAPEFPWHLWDHDRRHVLVTVGTLVGHMIGDFYERAAAVLAPLADEVQAVFVTSGVAAESFPDNAIVAELVPMLDLMPKLDAVVCHAGGAVNEALAFGVPMVVAPVRAEQVALARQVARSGAGVEVPVLDVTVAELDAALRAVLDGPDHRDAARRIAAEFSAAGGAAAAAAHLVGLASGA